MKINNTFLQTRLQLYVGEVTNIRSGPLRNFRLCHVDSLISFLLLVRAKIMIRNDQNPFDQVSVVIYCLRRMPAFPRFSLSPLSIRQRWRKRTSETSWLTFLIRSSSPPYST